MIAPKIIAQIQYVECPSCGRHLEGFVGDPRGAGIDSPQVECEACGQLFSITYDVVVELT